MVRIDRAKATQFIQQFLRDQLRRGVLHAVNNAMPDRFHGTEIGLLLQPIDQKLRRRLVIGSIDLTALLLILVRDTKG